MIEHLISRPNCKKKKLCCAAFYFYFDLRFLQEEYARRVSMKYFYNMQVHGTINTNKVYVQHKNKTLQNPELKDCS